MPGGRRVGYDVAMTVLTLCVAVALAGGEVLLPSLREIRVEESADGEVRAALSAWDDRRFEEAARRLGALAEASSDPELDWLAGVAWYEAGLVNRAEATVAVGLTLRPEHAGLLLLSGLIHADRGAGDEALGLLDRAERAAPGDPVLQAQVALNRGLVALDRGETDRARRALEGAAAQGRAAGRPEIVRRADDNLALVDALEGHGGAGDALARVTDALARGDVEGARAAIPAEALDRRGTIRRLIGEGAIARAEGRYDAAVAVLQQAVARARESGLVREEAGASAQLGAALSAAGRFSLARAELEAAVGRVEGTSFRVSELAWRVATSRVAVRQGDLVAARAHLARADVLLAEVRDARGAAGAHEASGLLAAAEGEVDAARAAYQRAWAGFEGLGAWAEAARVATEEVELSAGRDEAALAAARERAGRAFRAASDPLGPVHVGIAEGLGRAREKDLDGALRAFVAAAEAAEPLGARGQRLGQLARENAAQALVGRIGSEAARARSGEWGLEQVVSRYARFTDGQAAYDEALEAYQAGRFDEARRRFDAAAQALDGIGEAGYGKAARRGRAWAEYNASLRLAPEVALSIYQRLVEEGVLVEDAELRIRSMGAAALAAAELGRPEARLALAAAAEHAEDAGLMPLAGQCWAGLVDREPVLADRVAAAERAYALRSGDEIGRYAVYSAAVAAYEAEDYVLAARLAERILPMAGPLAPAVREVRDAARGMLNP